MRSTTSSGPVIVGGGPAGTAAAIALARAGRDVTLIERSTTATDKVCGDFLSPEAAAIVRSLGVDLSAASSITALRLIHRRWMATTSLPFTARGITRRALDEALLHQALASGATVVRGHRIGAIEHDLGSLQLMSGSLGRIAAKTVFLATGKHELRGVMRTSRGRCLVGLKMYYDLNSQQADALRQHVELILFSDGYAGLQLVEGDRAVLCMLVSDTLIKAVNGQWNAMLDALMVQCPHLRDRLSDARALLERPLSVANIPYGYVYAANQHDPPGLFRLGDQAAVIPSLTGDGVALALASGLGAAHTWLIGGAAVAYHRWFAAGLSRQMRLASTLHLLCLNSCIQPWLIAASRCWPGAIRFAASATRAAV
jgi:2-polyprenyl-6-methoxyphenol hydroxylase-like FAD-dependent oxidoreductase